MIRNLVEEHVTQAYEQLRPRFPDFCGCETCRMDVLVYALNRLPARYVVGREGTVVSEVNLDKDQTRVLIDVTVMDAIRKVTVSPRCKARGSGAR